MKRIRRILKWTAGTLVGLVLLLIALGYFFEDRLHLLAIRELGKVLNARIEVEETDVSFLRSWPDISVELKGLTINPVDTTYPYDVISVASADFKIDFWSIFSDQYEIHEVNLHQPRMELAIDAKGALNMRDMFQPPGDSTEVEREGEEKEEVVFALEEVAFYDGEFVYRDARDGLDIAVDRIALTMEGDFSADDTEFDTEMALHVDRWYDGRMYWAQDKNVKADLIVAAAFGEQEAYTLRDAQVQLAGLRLDLVGDIQRRGAAYALNLDYVTSENSFASFLSLLPGGLLETGREYEYDGNFMMKGWVRGLAGPGQAPDVFADYKVTDGSFHYVGYDARLTDVQMQGEYLLDQAAPEKSRFKVNDFHARLSDKALSGKLVYSDFTDPRLAFNLKGDVGLQDVRDFYPEFADSARLSGTVNVDINVEGRIADFREKRYARIKAIGGVGFAGVLVSDPRLDHPIRGLTGQVRLDNHQIQVNSLSGAIGSSDFAVKGTVTEYLPWFFNDDAVVRGKIEMQSKVLDLNEWLVEGAAEPGKSLQENALNPEEERFVFTLPKNLDLTVQAEVADFRLAKLRATGVRGHCRMHDQQLKLHALDMQALSGKLHVSGSITVLARDRCRIRLDATMSDVDINETFRTFDQLAAFALVEENLYGRLTGDVHITGFLNQYLDLDPNSLLCYGNVTLREGKLIDFEPLESLAMFVKLEKLRHIEFSDANTNFRIEEGYFYVPGLSLMANDYKLDLAGRHGFDNSLDYSVHVELPRDAAKRSENEDVQALIDTNEGDPLKVVIPVRITGTVDKPKYRLEGKYLKTRLAQQVKDQGTQLKQGVDEEVEELFGGKDSLQVDDLIDEVEGPQDNAVVSKLVDKIKNPFKKIRLGKKKRTGGN